MSELKFWLVGLVWSVSISGAFAQSYDAPETLDKKKPPQSQPLPGDQALGPMTLLAPAGLLIASFDTNGDYQISRAEFDVGYEKSFTRIDRDKNNKLTLIEIESWREKALGSKDARPSAMYFEGNFDQVISRKEFETAFETLFTNADKNDDERVEFGELIRVVERRSRPPVEKSERREFRQRQDQIPGRYGRR